ncbi:MAG: hypothetical protein H7Z75_03640 [Ferruginibacter sp.]|nr:hypothetical protein [Cytophagales bacterium]
MPFPFRWKSFWAHWSGKLGYPFFIRLRHWEYWPFAVVYFPVFFYWIWLAIKARSPFFFSAANPSIETGGMLGESKVDILNQISDQYKPKTLFIPRSTSLEAIRSMVAAHRIAFPLIAKPNVGERGWRVEKIHDGRELASYVGSNRVDFLIQAYVDTPLELGIFYYRFPGQSQGVVSSVVRKEFLSVRGDGRSSLLTLIQRNERARLQLDVLKAKYRARLHQVLRRDETLTLVHIGNHCRGTKFLNGNHLINEQLTRVFDDISQSIEGFHFGRYDVRCTSLADLYAGKGIRILELNGAGAEPAHIYEPGFSVREAYRVLFHHWRVLYQISRENHRRGVPYLTLREAVQFIRKSRAHKKSRQ